MDSPQVESSLTIWMFTHYVDDKPVGTEGDSCQNHHHRIIPKRLAH